jgi:hypothetical protein
MQRKGSSSYDSVPESQRSRSGSKGSKSNTSHHSNGAALRASQRNIIKRNSLGEIEF